MVCFVLYKRKKVVKLVEKPKKIKSNLAVTGLYFFDNNAIQYSNKLKPSKRGELEIIDLLNLYKKSNKLKVEFIGRGGVWLDTGNVKDYYEATNFISAVENNKVLKLLVWKKLLTKING